MPYFNTSIKKFVQLLLECSFLGIGKRIQLAEIVLNVLRILIKAKDV